MKKSNRGMNRSGISIGVLFLAMIGGAGFYAATRAGVVERPFMNERVFTCEAVMRAPLVEVWKAWTTTEGVKGIGIPGANIELRVGGAYEWYFASDVPAGQKGTEGCTVLAYVPMQMVAFTWNAPPAIPALREAQARTQVVVMLDELPGERVRVKLHQLGYGTGEDWDQYYAYFEKAWPKVLAWMQAKFEKESHEGTEPRSHEGKQ